MNEGTSVVSVARDSFYDGMKLHNTKAERVGRESVSIITATCRKCAQPGIKRCTCTLKVFFIDAFLIYQGSYFISIFIKFYALRNFF